MVPESASNIMGGNLICQRIVVSSNFMPILARLESLPCKFSANDSLTSQQARPPRSFGVRIRNRLWARSRGGKRDPRKMVCKRFFRGVAREEVRLNPGSRPSSSKMSRSQVALPIACSQIRWICLRNVESIPYVVSPGSLLSRF